MQFQLIGTSYQNLASGPAIKLYGRQSNGDSVNYTITGFKPYFYVLPKNFDEVKSLLDTFQEVTEYYEEYKDILVKVVNDPDLPIVYNVNFGHATPRCIWRILTAGFAEQNGRNAKLNGRIIFDY